MDGGLSQLAKSVANSVEVLPLIYKDLAQPSVQKVGKALETVFDLSNTILLPAKLLNERSRYWFEKHMNSYKDKLDTINTDKICDVPPELGIPLLDKLTYTTNYEIADLFTTLLMRASSVDTAGQAHPKFVSIISSLSIDEAKIIKYIEGDILYSNLRVHRKGRKGYVEILSHATGIEKKIDLLFPDNIDVYMQNLVTLGLLTDMAGSYRADEELYDEIHEMYEDFKEEIVKQNNDLIEQVNWNNSYYKLNDLGKLFINSCNIE